MSEKKYQIFVSSTFKDLIDERQDAIRNILDLKHIPAGMELFPSADVDQLEYIKKVIDECDYYLIIMGGRYGSMDAEGISYTEREYDYAVHSGKAVLAFVHGDPESIAVGKSDVRPEVVVTLNAFREKVMKGRLVRSWTTRQNLEPLILKSLIHSFNDNPQTGWIRGDAAAKEPLIEQSNKILQENIRLRTEIANLKPSGNFNTDNIADLEDEFKVRYSYRYWDGGSYSDRFTSIDLTWKRIFVCVAAQLDKSKTDAVIFIAFCEALRESGGGVSPSKINETDKVRIKIQLVALGLISARVSQTTQGGVEEFLTLTEKGRILFMDVMVVRKA